MRRVLITGATGFLGKHCLEKIDSKLYEIHATYFHSIVKTDKNNISWHKIDLHNHNHVANLLNDIKPEYLLHLAWYMEPDLKLNNKIHHKWFKSGVNLVNEFIQNGGRKIVVSGSCAEYDWSYPVCNENKTPLTPDNDYGESKNSLRKHIEFLYQAGKINYNWGRIFFTYGPGEKPQRLVPYVIKSILNEEIAHCTSCQQEYDYMYIEDVASALVQMLEIDFNGPINISSGKPQKLKDIVLKIGEILKGEEYIMFGSKKTNPKAPMFLVGDNSKLLSEVKFTSEFSLEEGLKRTILQYRNQNQCINV